MRGPLHNKKPHDERSGRGSSSDKEGESRPGLQEGEPGMVSLEMEENRQRAGNAGNHDQNAAPPRLVSDTSIFPTRFPDAGEITVHGCQGPSGA